MRFLLLAVLTAAAVFTSGCFGVNLPKQEVRETVSYDLLPLPAEERNFTEEAEILPFHSDSPAKYKMLHRKGTRLSVDEYSKWGQTPSAMLTRLFRSAFDPSKMTDRALRLSGTILRFEANDDSMTADLTVQYILTSQHSADPLLVRTLTVSEPRKENTPEAFAEAMSQAALTQIRQLKTLIREETKQK